NPSSRLIESGIALSIIFAAWNNLHPRFNQNRWKLAFAFGLLHGFGFAAVLADLGLSSKSLALSLLGFNIGVETGQLVILLFLFPLTFRLRNKYYYPGWILQRGSLAAASVAFIWLIERGANQNFSQAEFSLLSLLVFLSIFLIFTKATSGQVPRAVPLKTAP
ncbi:MAG TPA: hypothetical protein ENJ84_00745, partial [Gammaproteobacteria bacterium]|nr:hypothetical protein [Gammaproteobacteria bacterium]